MSTAPGDLGWKQSGAKSKEAGENKLALILCQARI